MPDELDRLFDPLGYVGQAAAFVDRVVTGWRDKEQGRNQPMPHITTGDGTRIFYQFDGEEGLPVLLLSNSLGTTLEMWDPQMRGAHGHYRVLRYDSRGHGRSDAPEGPYEIARLGRDAVELLDALDIETVRFCGLSKGGMVGMWLGVHEPDRIERLVLANTSAYIGAPEVWNARIETVQRDGMAAIVPGVIERWFTPRFQKAEPAAVRAHRRHAARYAAAGLCRLLRRRPRHGPAGAISPDIGADAGDRGHP